MRYAVDRHYYSYFGGADKHEYKYYTNLQEAWHAYKYEKANDFNYGDAWQYTSLRVIHDYSVALKPQRPHARSAQEWRQMVWEKEDAIKRKNMARIGIQALFGDWDDDWDATWQEVDRDDCGLFEFGDCGLFDDFVDDGLPF